MAVTLISEALVCRLEADAALVANLSTYDFGGGGSPAIFTSFEVPEDAAAQHIHIRRIAGDGDFGTKDARGGDSFYRVRVVGDKLRSDKLLEETADMVFNRINRADLRNLLGDAGIEPVGCFADPPIVAFDEDRFPAYDIICRVQFVECT